LQLLEEGLQNLRDEVGSGGYGGRHEGRSAHHDDREEAP